MTLDRDVVQTLSGVSTATITTILLKKGLRNVWMRGPRPLRPGQKRVVGRAFTLSRFHTRGRGRVAHIEKYFSNLTVVVREREEEKA